MKRTGRLNQRSTPDRIYAMPTTGQQPEPRPWRNRDGDIRWQPRRSNGQLLWDDDGHLKWSMTDRRTNRSGMFFDFSTHPPMLYDTEAQAVAAAHEADSAEYVPIDD